MPVSLLHVWLEIFQRKTRYKKHRRGVAFAALNTILNDGRVEGCHWKCLLTTKTAVKQPFQSFHRVRGERLECRRRRNDDCRNDALGMPCGASDPRAHFSRSETRDSAHD